MVLSAALIAAQKYGLVIIKMRISNPLDVMIVHNVGAEHLLFTIFQIQR